MTMSNQLLKMAYTVRSFTLSIDERLDLEDEEWLNAKIADFKISKDENYVKGTLSCALCFTPVSFYYSKYFFY